MYYVSLQLIHLGDAIAIHMVTAFVTAVLCEMVKLRAKPHTLTLVSGIVASLGERISSLDKKLTRQDKMC